jgi:hypothetical protein
MSILISCLPCDPDQEVISKLAEVDMMVADLERANSRVATVERRNVSDTSLFMFRNPKTFCIGTATGGDRGNP